MTFVAIKSPTSLRAQLDAVPTTPWTYLVTSIYYEDSKPQNRRERTDTGNIPGTDLVVMLPSAKQVGDTAAAAQFLLIRNESAEVAGLAVTHQRGDGLVVTIWSGDLDAGFSFNYAPGAGWTILSPEGRPVESSGGFTVNIVTSSTTTLYTVPANVRESVVSSVVLCNASGTDSENVSLYFIPAAEAAGQLTTVLSDPFINTRQTITYEVPVTLLPGDSVAALGETGLLVSAQVAFREFL